MKRLIAKNLLFVALIIGALLVGYKAAPTDHDLARVNKFRGKLVFSDSYPDSKYEVIGEVQSNGRGFAAAQYEDVRNRLFKNADKEYRDYDGLILYMNNDGADRAEVIKFQAE